MRTGYKHDGNSPWTIKFKKHLAKNENVRNWEGKEEWALPQLLQHVTVFFLPVWPKHLPHTHTVRWGTRTYTPSNANHPSSSSTKPFQASWKKNSTHFSVARGSLFFFWRYRSNDDSALFFFLPAVRHFLLSVDLLLQLSNKPTATFHLSPQRQDSVHSAPPTPQVVFRLFFF